MKKLILLTGLLLIPSLVFGGIDFDGVDDKVAINATLNPGTSDLTVHALVYINSVGDSRTHMIYDANSTGGIDRVQLYVADATGLATFYFNAGAADSDIFATSTTDVRGAWHFITGVRTSAKVGAIYIDGISEDTDTHTGGNSSVDVTKASVLGQDNWGYNPLSGIIADFAYWTSERTAAQILQLASSKLKYQALNIGAAPSVYLTMDDGVDGTAADLETCYDKSGNARDGNPDNGANNTGLAWSPESILSYIPKIIQGN